MSRIIFYVDDLDRLEPEAAVGFLEDLKNSVICKNCIFILALDHEIVWRGIQRKYDIPCRQLDEWTGVECGGREEMIVPALKELFSLGEQGNAGYRQTLSGIW